MPLEKIYIARHGFRLSWFTNVWQSPTGLARDPPLAAYGEFQAKELAHYFSSLPEDEKPTAIFSSPYYRCLQTALPVAQTLGLPLLVEHGLSEFYCPTIPGTGLHPRPSSATSLKSFIAEIDPEWSSLWYPSQKGETVSEVHDRTDAFLQVFIPQIEHTYAGKHTNILLVGHAATVIALTRSLMGDRELPLRVGCCSLTELVPKVQDSTCATQEVLGAWEAKKLADGKHLEDGAMRDWGFEDLEIEAGKVIEEPGVPGTETHIEGPSGAQTAHSML
ncbi:hypothetical protein Agabi119p4_516 [Agaricus bisporus var. burnettii]|uniref:Phosphoglycerate mutase-like protein n=1 Tax=Agaricus bisporus var. burnettii TaxID=192524 RepID=A0A8H7FB02_AGABI|nr:hypothetical protein Agabi119p4_516 [Agaricus bisporus var. burnettii]